MANLSNINNKFIVSDVGHVSIGATTTTYPLTVESGGVGTVLRAGTSFVSIDSVGSAASPSLIFNGDSNTGIWRPAADTLGFSTAGSEKMRIDSSGNVLIGIASTYPQGDNTILKLYSPSVPRFYLQNTTTGSNTTDGSQIYVNGSDLYITNSESANTIFSTNSLQRMRIDSAGNVNIGPDALDIQLKAASNNSGKNLIYLRGNAIGDKAEISLNHYGSANFFIGVGTTTATTMSLTASSGGTDGIIIDTSGNVGIGVTPNLADVKLHTYNNSTNAYNIFESSTRRWVFGQVGDVAQVAGVYGVHGGVIVDGATGNVGIGTDSPTNGKFVINRNSSAASFGGNICQLFENFNTTDGQMMSIGFRNNNSVGTTAYIDAVAYDQSIGATDIRFSTYSGSAWSSNMVTFQHTGRVGIGTTGPTQKLDVNGQMTHDGLVLKTGTSVYIDTIQTIDKTLSITGGVWTNTGIEGTDIGANGSYMIQVYSNAHGTTGGAWYSMYWTGVMSWYKDSSNGINASEIYLNFSGHALNSNVLQLRTVQHTSSGTPANLMSLEIKTSNTLTNAPISFRFRRLM